MIGTIRKHQKWLWGVIITATIVSFVVYFSPTQRYGGGGMGSSSSSRADLGVINGEPITKDQLVAAEREALIFYRLRAGSWPTSADQQKQIRKIAEQSLVVQSILKEYKIEATDDAGARFAKQVFGVPVDQPMPMDAFNKFLQNELEAKAGLNKEDFARWARHQAGQECLMSLFGMPGELITSKEAEFFYRRENEPMLAEVLKFETTNYLAATNPTETDLQEWFNLHQAEYRIPDRIQVNYVYFDPSNYMAKADKLLGTNLDEKAEEIYRERGPEAFRDKSGNVLTNTAAIIEIKKDMQMMVTTHEAINDAYTALSALAEGHDATHPYSPDDLAKVAAKKGLTVKTSEPFDERDGSKELNLPPRELHILFSLRNDDTNDVEREGIYATVPLTNSTGVYVAGLVKRIPSQLQVLAAVKDRALKDYKESMAADAVKEAGEQFSSALQIGLMQGKTFDAVCAAQKLKPETLAPFALTTTNLPAGFDKATFQQVQEMLFQMPVSESSKFIPTEDGGMIVYLKQRLPVDETKMVAELPMYLARMRQQRQIAAFNEWLSKQFQMRYIQPASEQQAAAAGGAG